MGSDTMLSQLLAFPPHPAPPQPLLAREYDTGAKKVLQFIEGLSDAKLTSPVSGSDSLLDIIDPSINSIPYLFALLAHIRTTANSTPFVPSSQIWEHAVRFLQVFDPAQVRYCGKEFRHLLELFNKGSQDDIRPGIEAIVGAMLRLESTCSTLTSTHLLVVDRCLRERAFSLALPILDKDIYHLPRASLGESGSVNVSRESDAPGEAVINVNSGLTQAFTYQDQLRYFLLGASIYIACKQWTRAITFLEIVLATPIATGHVSMIQVEAYKRWCLISLLVYGRPGRTPRNMTQFAAKQCQNVARAYFALAEMFTQVDTQRLQAEIDVGPFQTDGNYSLARMVLNAHYRFAVLNLAQIYSHLPVSSIPALISRPTDSTEETSNHIAKLIDANQLRARLLRPEGTRTDTILEFLGDASIERSEESLLNEQKEARQRIQALSERMREAQKRIESSNEYVAAARKQRKEGPESKDPKLGLDVDDMLTDDL